MPIRMQRHLEINVNFPHDSKLGLDCDFSDLKFVKVVAVKPGIISDWNAANPTMAIAPGDHILKVNGIGSTNKMLRQLKKRGDMILCVVSFDGNLGKATVEAVPQKAIGETKLVGDRDIEELCKPVRSQRHMEISVNYPNDSKLGLDCDFSHLKFVTVLAVKPGIISDWNAANPTMAIAPGDHILKVNGIDSTNKMLRQLKERGDMILSVVSFEANLGEATVEAVPQKAMGETKLVGDRDIEERCKPIGIKRHMEISVSYPHGSKLGLDCDFSDPKILTVFAVKPGIISDWNAANPTMAIAPGDHILKVNGIGSTNKMLRQLKKRGDMILSVVSFEVKHGEATVETAPKKAMGDAKLVGDRDIEERLKPIRMRRLMEISVNYPNDSKLGLDCDFSDPKFVTVLAVKPGIISDWNAANPTMAIAPGDHILKVNGIGSTNKMLRQLKKRGDMILSVVSFEVKHREATVEAVPQTAMGDAKLVGDRNVEERRKLIRRQRHMEISVNYPNDSKLGLDCDFSVLKSVTVLAVKPGIISDWNAANPTMTIAPGDHILKVNGIDSTNKMLRQLKKRGDMILSVVSF